MCAKILHANATICKRELLQAWPGMKEMQVEAFVVSSLQPFSGIDPLPDNPKHPVYLYLILDREYSEQELSIATEGVEERFRLANDLATGIISWNNNSFGVIRFKQLDSPETIDNIAFLLETRGLSFFKGGLDEPFSGRLTLRKFLYLEEVAYGCYLDRVEPQKGYLLLEEDPTDDQILHWEQLDTLDDNLDLATGTLVHAGSEIPMIRIYSRQMDGEVLLLIKKALSL